MKKVFTVLIMLLLCTLCSCKKQLQNADDLPENIDYRIVGTWESERLANSSFIFRADGTFERTDAFKEHSEGTYTAVDGVLTLDYGEGYKKKELTYKINTDKNSSDYGDLKIGHDYFEKK